MYKRIVASPGSVHARRMVRQLEVPKVYVTFQRTTEGATSCRIKFNDVYVSRDVRDVRSAAWGAQ